MDLRHLQTFAAAAEEGGFTRAAKALAITQAAVSKHVAALEAELGVPLFERAGRTISMTEAGRSLYAYARRIFDLVDEARREVGHREPLTHGPLRIALSSVPAQRLLPELLAEFRELYPAVHESVMVTDSASATEAVESGQADAGIVGERPSSRRIRSQAIVEDELVFVVAPQHALASRKQVTLAALGSEPLLVRNCGSGSQRCVERALAAAGLPPSGLNITVEANCNETIRAAVERGMGAGFLSLATIQREVTEGRLVPVPVAGVRVRRQLYLISDSKRIPTAASRAFLAFAEQWKPKPA